MQSSTSTSIDRISDSRRIRRTGMASLEFVMALPVLLTLMVGITWLGFSVIKQTEVTVEARNKAWKRRFEDASKNPLVFTAAKGFYKAKKDYVVEKATGQVRVSPLFNRMPGPESTHVVLAGSWDHRAMALDKPPSWKQHTAAVLNAKTAGVQTTFGNLENLADNLSNQLGDTLADALDKRNELDGMGSSSQASGSGNQQETERKRQEEKRAAKTRRDALDAQVKSVRNEILGLQAQKLKLQAESVAATGKEKEQLDAEIDRLDRRIRLLESRKERLESELRDAQAEYNALS